MLEAVSGGGGGGGAVADVGVYSKAGGVCVG